MKELRCPHCQNLFQVDDDIFESIAGQVRNQAFDEELQRRIADHRAAAEAEMRTQMARHDSEIALLGERMNAAIGKKEAEMKEMVAGRDLEIARLREQIESFRQTAEARMQSELVRRENEAAKTLAEKEAEITRLKADIDRARSDNRLNMLEQQQKATEEFHRRDQRIAELTHRIEAEQRAADLRVAELNERHAIILQEKDATIELYKNFKARLSTKGVGESLENHCNIEFEKIRAVAYPNAYFSKDNDASDGTKGDFIFRDFDGGEEYVSIMFEMKNQTDETATPHRNEEFFAKLDSDRRKKGCEYAVLVSMLEPENDLYNQGIVDVSHRYDKMFVIRPQFFLPVIGLIASAARRTIAYRRKMREMEERNISFVRFEEKLTGITDGILQNYDNAHRQIEKSIGEIDKTIKNLNALRGSLLSWERHMRLAADKSEKLTVKKLTHGLPDVRKAIDAAAESPDSGSADIFADTPASDSDIFADTPLLD